MGPPCGTASRAHEIPAGPPPSRSDQCPWGLPDLEGVHLTKVRTANEIYLFIAKVAVHCAEAGIGFLIENPARSHFGGVDVTNELLGFRGVFDVSFHSRMFGGLRKKVTTFPYECA